MKRLAILAIVAVLAACGSDNNGPTEKFTGSWTGRVIDGGDTQNGSAVTGSGTASSGATSYPMTFTGTSTPPTLNLTLLVNVGTTQTLVYTGSYVSSDSIVGTVSNGGVSEPLDLGKN
jgi:hypothetical protein